MDVAGARALAQRIAHGKPIDEETTAGPPIDHGVAPRVELTFVHPCVLDRETQVWMYVRGTDGHLHRAR
jgi:hypothetical protein